MALADLVFVGGSLVNRGGQNMIEAARHGRAILMGPSAHNFLEIVAAFQAGGGLVSVQDADELMVKAEQFLSDPARRAALGQRAARVAREHRGAAQRYVRTLQYYATDTQQ
jgi:3-deoxy-D-manno-octulosonic-acid transferase